MGISDSAGVFASWQWGRVALWVFALLPSLALLLVSASWHSPYVPHDFVQLLIPPVTLLISTVGTISTIWLAWRKESRDSREYTLKIQQLEMQVAELRAKNLKESEEKNPKTPQ